MSRPVLGKRVIVRSKSNNGKAAKWAVDRETRVRSHYRFDSADFSFSSLCANTPPLVERLGDLRAHARSASLNDIFHLQLFKECVSVK